MTAQMTEYEVDEIAVLPRLSRQVLTIDELDDRPVRYLRTARVVSIQSWSAQIGKRTGDLVIGSIMCLVTSVVVLGLMVGSAISFKAMPLFTQQRVGKHGRRFLLLKIRSLPASAPADADKWELNAVPNTGFGRFIRSKHLDELPQLWMVLRGRMSLVGPRPAIPSLIPHFGDDHLASRSPLRPGCTGMWQISPALVGMIYDGAEYDQFYAEQMCGRLDLWILWHTALQAVGGASKTLDDVPRWAYAYPSRAVPQRNTPRYPARAE